MAERLEHERGAGIRWSVLALVVLVFAAALQSALMSRVRRTPGRPVAAAGSSLLQRGYAAGSPVVPEAAPKPARRPILEPLGRLSLTGSEIVAYEPASNCLFAATGHGVAMVHLGDGRVLALVREIDVVGASGLPPGNDGRPAGEVSHVAVDPAGRGFGAATVIPQDAAGTRGRLVFFSTRTGDVLGAVETGFGPDSCVFAPDGAWLVVADEGEPRVRPDGSIVDPPGSITVVRTDRPRSALDARSLSQADAATFGFEGPALDEALRRSGADGSGLRIRSRNHRDAARDLEPEFAAVMNGVAYVTLQENNAIAVFDLKRGRWKAVEGLGQRLCRIDASDRDGGVRIDKQLLGLPMPDQIGACVIDGVPVLITADEGDDGGDWTPGGAASPLADVARLGELAAAGRLASGPLGAMDLSDSGAGRLHVLTDFTDDEADGVIDRVVMPGARTMSVWSAASLDPLGNTGDQFEQRMALHPAFFNAGSPKTDAPDTRSDDRGPEPEGIALGRMNGWTLAFVSLERPGGLATVDLGNPRAPAVLGVYPATRDGDIAPEGLCFIPREASPTGEPLLVAAFEVSKTLRVYSVSLPEKQPGAISQAVDDR